MDKKMNFKYFYGTEADQFSFYRIPKALFTNDCFKDLSCDAKILYGLMLDRMSLSIKNQSFMATDYVTSPLTNKGKFIYALCCGIITCLIRVFASLPEGVSYSIVLMNIIVPLIERATVPKPFGTVKEAK